MDCSVDCWLGAFSFSLSQPGDVNFPQDREKKKEEGTNSEQNAQRREAESGGGTKMWSAIKSDLFDFVSTIKEDTTTTLNKVLGEEGDEQEVGADDIGCLRLFPCITSRVALTDGSRNRRRCSPSSWQMCAARTRRMRM